MVRGRRRRNTTPGAYEIPGVPPRTSASSALKKSNAEDAEEGGYAARSRRDEFPSVPIRVHPCPSVFDGHRSPFHADDLPLEMRVII